MQRPGRPPKFNQMVEHLDPLDRTLHALADPTRRALLVALRGGPSTVGALAEPIEMSLAAVSKHVRVLERAGLLEREVRGREHHLRLDARPLRAVEALAQAFSTFTTGRRPRPIDRRITCPRIDS